MTTEIQCESCWSIWRIGTEEDVANGLELIRCPVCQIDPPPENEVEE